MKTLKAFIFFSLIALNSSWLWAADVNSTEHILSRIPVQDGGRVKPFASFAKESVVLVTGKSSFENLEASRLAWEWISDPQKWASKPLLPVGHPDLKKYFSVDLVKNRIAPNLVLNDLEFARQVNEARAADEEKKATPLDHKKIELHQRARLFSAIANAQIPGFVPHPENPKVPWLPLEAFMSKEGVEIIGQMFPSELVEKTQEGLFGLLKKIKSGELNKAELRAELFAKSLNELLLSHDMVIDPLPIQLELWYLKLRPFYLAWLVYLLSFLLWLSPKKKKGIKHLAIASFVAALLIHSAGFIMRVMIAGRPPVSNMYESIIWVSWSVAVFALILWLFYRSTTLFQISSCISALTLLIGESFPTLLNPNLSPLTPVLRSNYWLTIHVLTITLGYGAFALNWGIAHTLLYVLAFQPERKQLQSDLSEHLYRSLQIGLIFLTAGTILGGVWAADSWGRFWGWDPKETWALIAILAYLAVLHSRTAGWLDLFGSAFWSALCFLTVIMAWYGVNFVLGAGLHSYGFGGGGVQYVGAVVLADLFLLLFFARRFKIKS